MSFESYGLRIGLRVSDPAVLGRAVECLPPGWKQGRSPVVDQLYSLVVGSRGISSKEAPTPTVASIGFGQRMRRACSQPAGRHT